VNQVTKKGSKLKIQIFLMSSLYRNEYKNLKLAETTIGRGLGRNEEE
jgi:hypothetical protein